jgi:DNA repair exonuclease SbcCD ATPase subunit
MLATVNSSDNRDVVVCDGKYDTLYHISDIHIRLNPERFDEYSQVFDKVFAFIDSHPKKDTAISIITGDIFHSFNVHNNCSNALFHKLICGLSNRTPVLLMIGNHDMSKREEGLIDNIFSLIGGLYAYKPIHYQRFSGCVRFGNVLFGISSLYDNGIIAYNEVIKSPIYGKHCHVVGCYHGMIREASTLLKMNTENGRVKNINEFGKYPFMLLGDIHKPLQINGNTCYAGSLIQQTFGEDVNEHGILVWSLNNDPCHTFHTISNDYSMVNLTIKKGECVEPINHLSKNIRVKVWYDVNCDPSCLVALEKKLESKYNLLSYQRSFRKTNTIDIGTESKVEISEASHLEFVNNCILKRNPEKSTELKALHKKYHEIARKNSKVVIDQLSWKINSIRFKNVFTYGQDKEYTLDFSALPGTIYISGRNASGKSNLLRMLVYAMTGGINKELKAGIRNELSKKYSIDTCLDIGGKQYSISRSGAKAKDDRYVLSKSKLGSAIFSAPTGGNRSIIKDYFSGSGKVEHFLALYVFSNSIHVSLLGMTNAKRLDFLNNLFGVNIYGVIADQVKKDRKTLENEMTKVSGGAAITHHNINEIDGEKVAKQKVELSAELNTVLADLRQSDNDIKSLRTKKNNLVIKKIELCKELDSQDKDVVELEQRIKRISDYAEQHMDVLKSENKSIDILKEQTTKLLRQIIPINDHPERSVNDVKNETRELEDKKNSIIKEQATIMQEQTSLHQLNNAISKDIGRLDGCKERLETMSHIDADAKVDIEIEDEVDEKTLSDTVISLERKCFIGTYPDYDSDVNYAQELKDLVQGNEKDISAISSLEMSIEQLGQEKMIAETYLRSEYSFNKAVCTKKKNPEKKKEKNRTKGKKKKKVSNQHKKSFDKFGNIDYDCVDKTLTNRELLEQKVVCYTDQINACVREVDKCVERVHTLDERFPGIEYRKLLDGANATDLENSMNELNISFKQIHVGDLINRTDEELVKMVDDLNVKINAIKAGEKKSEQESADYLTQNDIDVLVGQLMGSVDESNDIVIAEHEVRWFFTKRLRSDENVVQMMNKKVLEQQLANCTSARSALVIRTSYRVYRRALAEFNLRKAKKELRKYKELDALEKRKGIARHQFVYNRSCAEMDKQKKLMIDTRARIEKFGAKKMHIERCLEHSRALASISDSVILLKQAKQRLFAVQILKKRQLLKDVERYDEIVGRKDGLDIKMETLSAQYETLLKTSDEYEQKIQENNKWLKVQEFVERNKETQAKLDIVAKHIQDQELRDEYALLDKLRSELSRRRNNDSIKKKIKMLDSGIKASEIALDKTIENNRASGERQGELMIRIKECDVMLKRLDGHKQKANETHKQIAEIKNKLNLLEDYAFVVGNKGVVATILEQFLIRINKQLNDFLVKFVEYKVKLTLVRTNKKSELIMGVEKKTPNGVIQQTTGMLSGYETFILEVAFKFVLNKNACRGGHSQIFCIDEGLDVIDDANINKLPDLLNFLKQHYSNILLVSHLGGLSKICDHHIHVKRQGPYSTFSVVH